jgi:hypothetical protein
MDKDSPLVCSVKPGTSDENQVDSEPDNIDVFYEFPQLNNSFEDLEDELGKKGLLSHVAEPSDEPLEVMGIENTWYCMFEFYENIHAHGHICRYYNKI